MALQPYNITLPSTSPTFIYAPFQDGYWGEDGDANDGWRSSFNGSRTTWPAPSSSNWIDGTAYHETYKDGATVSFQFEGTDFYLCVFSRYSTYDLLINGTAQNPQRMYAQPRDSACAMQPNGVMYLAQGLPYGMQQVQLVAHPGATDTNAWDDPTFQFYGATLTLGMNGTQSGSRTIDDTDPGWTYSRSWTSALTNPYASNNSLHRICTYGAASSATYKFTSASAVQLLGQTSVDAGPYTVSLSSASGNVSKTYNASSYWTSPQVVLFYQADLNSSLEYTLSLTNFDPTNPDSFVPLVSNDLNNTCASIDALVLVSATPLPWSPPPSSSDSSTTGAIIGGVLGAAALVVLAFGWWWWRKRQARKAAERRAAAEVDPAMEDAIEASRAEPNPFFLGTIGVPTRRPPGREGPSSEALLLHTRTNSSEEPKPPDAEHAEHAEHTEHAEPSPPPAVPLPELPPFSVFDNAISPPLPTTTPDLAQQPSLAQTDVRTVQGSTTGATETVPISPSSGGDHLENTSTAELVRVLNQRLQAGGAARREDSGDEPPPGYTVMSDP